MKSVYPSKIKVRKANKIFPTLPPIAIRQILIEADLDTVENICQLPELEAYCKSDPGFSEVIFKEKAIIDFKENITTIKPDNMTWEEFYKRARIIVDNYKRGNYNYNKRLNSHLLELQVIHEYDPAFIPPVFEVIEAATYGHVEVLKLLNDMNAFTQIQPVGDYNMNLVADPAVRKNRVEAVEYLAQHGIWPSEPAVIYASSQGYIDTIRALHRNGYVFTNLVAIYSYPHQDLANFFTSIGIDPNINNLGSHISNALSIVNFYNAIVGIENFGDKQSLA